jgi:hypothetical protein
MKQILLMIGIFVASMQGTFAQKTFSKAFSSSAKQKIILKVGKCDFEIAGSTGNELKVTADKELPPPPERAKGLKPMYNNATDNTGIGLDIQEAGGVMTIRKATSQKMAYKLTVPAGADITIKEDGWDGKIIKIKDISGEIEVELTNSSIELENVTGPVVGNTLNGNFDIKFTKMNTQKPTDISTINGHIDISMPVDTKANLDITTMNGESFTDFDIKEEQEDNGRSNGLKELSGGDVTGTINGGGVAISLNSINGNIYLRKK